MKRSRGGMETTDDVVSVPSNAFELPGRAAWLGPWVEFGAPVYSDTTRGVSVRTRLHRALIGGATLAALVAMWALTAAPASASAWGGAYTPGRYIPIGVPGFTNSTLAFNVNEFGVVTGLYSPTPPLPSSGLVGFVEIDGKYTSIADPALPTGTNIGLFNVTFSGEVLGGYTPPDGVSYALSDVNGKLTTLYDPNADYTDSTPFGGPGTSVWGSSMTGEITGYYPDKTASHTNHGFVYADGHWRTVDCPAGHGYVGSALFYVGDYGREMLALCWTANFATFDSYIYTPDRTFSSAPANFTQLPTPPGPYAANGEYQYNFVNDFGLAGGDEVVANPKPSNGCGETVQDAFVYENGQFTTIPPRAGLCIASARGANDRGVLALDEFNSTASASDSFLLTPGF